MVNQFKQIFPHSDTSLSGLHAEMPTGSDNEVPTDTVEITVPGVSLSDETSRSEIQITDTGALRFDKVYRIPPEIESSRVHNFMKQVFGIRRDNRNIKIL